MCDYNYLFTTEDVILSVGNKYSILWGTEVALLCSIKQNSYGQVFSGLAYELTLNYEQYHFCEQYLIKYLTDICCIC